MGKEHQSEKEQEEAQKNNWNPQQGGDEELWKGVKEIPKKKTPKNFTSTQQGGNKAHYKHTTMK
jgi:hypothetical protein